MAYDYSNVLAAIAKGVDFNPLGNLAEGWMTGRKMNIAQQQADADTKTAEAALLKAKNPQYDTPNSIQEVLWLQAHPEYADLMMKLKTAGNPYTVLPPGAVGQPKPGSGAPPIQGPSLEQNANDRKSGELSAAAKFDLPQMTASYESVNNQLSDIQKQARDLANDKGINGIYGVSGVFPNYPGGKAAGAKAKLDTLKANLSLDRLQQIREQSKTGGALGNVSNQDIDLLRDASVRLQQAQSAEDAIAVLKDLDAKMEARKAIRQKAYESELKLAGGGEQPQQGGGEQPSFAQPGQRAIDALKGNPQMQDEFDRKFGPGAAARILNGG